MSRAEAAEPDRNGDIPHKRDEFTLAEDIIYLCGYNRCPKADRAGLKNP